MYVYLAIALLSAALSGVGVWRVQSWRYAAMELERTEQVREDRVLREKTIDKAADNYERDRAQVREEFVVITQEVERVTKEPFYAAGQLCFDDGGLQQLRTATGANPAPASVTPSALPASAPSR